MAEKELAFKYLKAGFLRQDYEELPIYSFQGNAAPASPELYLQSPGFAEGYVARILDAHRNPLLQVPQTSYLRGRRMELLGPDGAYVGTILKMDHPQASGKTSAGSYLRSRYKGMESDTFMLQHGERTYQAERRYPAVECTVTLHSTDKRGKAEVCGKVTRSAVGNPQSRQILMAYKPQIARYQQTATRGIYKSHQAITADDMYWLKVSAAAPLEEVAPLLLMAVLMEEAIFAPHVLVPRVLHNLPPQLKVRQTLSRMYDVLHADQHLQGQNWGCAPEVHPPKKLAAPREDQQLILPEFDIDLASEATSLLNFLYKVDSSAWLHSAAAVHRAVRRYEQSWLPILAENAAEAKRQDKCPDKLAAPLDVAWAWLAHCLSPKAYAADFHALTNVPAPDIISVPHHRTAATLAAGRAAWEHKYPDEPFDAEQSCMKETAKYVPECSYDIAAAMHRQRDFLYQVALPHWTKCPDFIKEAVLAYKRFLALHRRYTTFLVPTYAIDLVWHAHQVQANHAAYAADAALPNGDLLNHDDTQSSREEGSERNKGWRDTQNLYARHFGEDYSTTGDGYRGTHPLDRYTPGAAPVPVAPCAKGAKTESFVIHQHGFSETDRQPAPLYIANDMPPGGVCVRLDATCEGCNKLAYQIWLSHEGPYSTKAFVHVVDRECKEVLATARLVGREQLPYGNMGSAAGNAVAAKGFTKASANLNIPALLQYSAIHRNNERTAFLISSRSHDWGVASATWHGHKTVVPYTPGGYTGVESQGRASTPGHLSVRLMRLGEAGACLPYYASRNLKGSKLRFSACSERSKPTITLNLGTPTKVKVREGEDVACALAFAGAVSLQAMILGLPVAALSKSKFAAGLLAAHGLSVAAPVQGHKYLSASDTARLGNVGGYTPKSLPLVPSGSTTPQHAYYPPEGVTGTTALPMFAMFAFASACGGGACGGACGSGCGSTCGSSCGGGGGCGGGCGGGGCG